MKFTKFSLCAALGAMVSAEALLTNPVETEIKTFITNPMR